ncbi:MAG: hypothetical protein LBB78_00870, partial [Spirochaetaceae bacterium]|nr:hypothetical protein [Spirochaetaceae bacterium]
RHAKACVDKGHDRLAPARQLPLPSGTQPVKRKMPDSDVLTLIPVSSILETYYFDPMNLNIDGLLKQ